MSASSPRRPLHAAGEERDTIQRSASGFVFSDVGAAKEPVKVMVPPRVPSSAVWLGQAHDRRYAPRVAEILTPPVRIPVEAFLKSRPTAPCFWFLSGETIYSLPVGGLRMKVSVHVSTASVKLRVIFVNTSKQRVDGIFALPLKGTVTSVEAKIGEW